MRMLQIIHAMIQFFTLTLRLHILLGKFLFPFLSGTTTLTVVSKDFWLTFSWLYIRYTVPFSLIRRLLISPYRSIKPFLIRWPPRLHGCKAVLVYSTAPLRHRYQMMKLSSRRSSTCSLWFLLSAQRFLGTSVSSSILVHDNCWNSNQLPKGLNGFRMKITVDSPKIRRTLLLFWELTVGKIIRHQGMVPGSLLKSY